MIVLAIVRGLVVLADDNDLPQDELEDEGAIDCDYRDTEYKLPSAVKIEGQEKTAGKQV